MSTLEPVLMLNPQGQVVPVDPAQVAQNSRLGFLPASQKQIEDFKTQQKYGEGTANEVEAGAAGLARGLTFGLSDQALTRTGLVKPETLKGQEEANPAIASGSEIAGGLIPLVATAGGSALEEAGAAGVKGVAKAAAEFTPSVLASKVGQGIEHGIAAALPKGEGLAARAASQALAKGAGSAVEGAAFQAGHEVSENALDPQWTAEVAAQHIGAAGLFGGALGGGLGVAGEALPAAVEKAKSLTSDLYGAGKGKLEGLYAAEGDVGGARLIADPQMAAKIETQIPGATEMLSKATPEIQDLMAKNTDKIQEISQKFGPKAVGNMVNLDPATFQKFADNIDAIVTDPEVRQQMQSGLEKAGQEVYKSAEKLSKQLYTEIAPAEAEKLVANADPAKVSKTYSALADKLEGAIAELKEKPDLYAPGYASTLKGYFDGMIRDVTGDPGQDFQRLRVLRQQLGDLSAFETGPKNIGQKNAIGLVRDLRSAVRDALTDADVFGEQAARQSALDDATHEMINAQKFFKKQFMSKIESADFRVKPTAVNTWLNQMADNRGAIKSEAWGKLMDAHKTLTQAVSDSFDNAPVGKFDRAGLDSLVDKTADMTEEARRKAATTQQWNLIQRRTSGWGSNPYVAETNVGAQALVHKGAGMLGSGIGGAIGGFPGAMLGAGIEKGIRTAMDLKSNITKQVATLAALERAGQEASKRIDVGVAAVVKGLDRASNVGRGEVAAGVSRLNSRTDKEKQATFERQTAYILQHAESLDAMQAHTDRISGDIAPHAPDTAAALAMQQAIMFQHLGSKVPKHAKVGPLDKILKSSPTEIGKFNRHVEAALKPLSVIKKIGNGTLMPEHMETLSVVHPQTLQKIQSALIHAIGTSPKDVPYKARRGIGMVLGQVPDASFAPQSIVANQAAYVSKMPPSSGPKPDSAAKSLTVSNRMLTPQQDSASRGR